jgi:hypothetical protein
VEQHNIFHNEVKAIGSHLAKDGDKVRQAVVRRGTREEVSLFPDLTRVLGSTCRSRTVSSRPSTRSCW